MAEKITSKGTLEAFKARIAAYSMAELRRMQKHLDQGGDWDDEESIPEKRNAIEEEIRRR